MPPTNLKRRRNEEDRRGKAPKERKRFKKQRAYHSSSEDEEDAPQEFAPVSLDSSDEEAHGPAKQIPKHKAKIAAKKAQSLDLAHNADPSDEDEQDLEVDDDDEVDSDASDLSDASDISETSTSVARKVRKRNDPEAFATSISKILGTKLTSQKRSEPILSRSKAAQDTNKSLADHKLTIKAQRVILAEKKAAQEKGRVKDVLGVQSEDVSTADVVAKEKALRRTAQRGVIKLFNAVRAAQVKAEQAEKDVRDKGIIGVKQREDAVKEMSKQGFLDMIAGGAKQKEGSVEA